MSLDKNKIQDISPLLELSDNGGFVYIVGKMGPYLSIERNKINLKKGSKNLQIVKTLLKRRKVMTVNYKEGNKT